MTIMGRTIKPRAEYRIARDGYSGYEVQYRTRWLRFWRQAGRRGGWGTNTSPTIERAEELARAHAGWVSVVKKLGWLP